MLEIIILFTVGKQFYQLAKKYEQKLAWVYVVLGIVSYYGSALLTGVLLALYEEFTGNYFLESMNNFVLTLIFMPIAALACWCVYKLLQNKWHKEYAAKEREKPKISDIGKSEDEIASEEF